MGIVWWKNELGAWGKMKAEIPRAGIFADGVVPDGNRSDECHSLRIGAGDTVRSFESTGISLRGSTLRCLIGDGKSADSRSSEEVRLKMRFSVEVSRRKAAKAVPREPITSSNSWKMDLERKIF